MKKPCSSTGSTLAEPWLGKRPIRIQPDHIDMKNTFIPLSFLLLFFASIGGAAEKEHSQLPEFGDYELEIFQIAGHLSLYVPPQVGDTTNMNKLKLDGIEEFLTFALQGRTYDLKNTRLLHDLSNPTLVVHNERKRSKSSCLGDSNKYMIRASTHADRKVVEVHIEETVRNAEKDYVVYVIQTFDGIFQNLVVLGKKGLAESYIRNAGLRYGKNPMPPQ